MKPETYIPEVGSKVVFTREALPPHITRDKEYTIHEDNDEQNLYIILDNGRRLHFIELFKNSWEVVE